MARRPGHHRVLHTDIPIDPHTEQTQDSALNWRMPAEHVHAPPTQQTPAERSAVATQLVEEVVDDVQLAGAGHLVIDVLAHREVEHPEAEG